MSQASGNEIAIIGISGRFPGAGTVDRFWRNLCAGVESIQVRSEPNADAAGSRFVPAVSRMDDYDAFDAAFFDIGPREAELLDPQQRVFLEECWSALENAGYAPRAEALPAGVFGGSAINTYLLLNVAGNSSVLRELDLVQLNVASAPDFLATRVSYKLNLSGPSHTVQSACSTSLVAVHAACQSLLNGECDMALAGGAAINVRFLSGYDYVPGGMLSPDGHCRAFDAHAAGTIFGAGAGVVVLKRLEDAIEARDFIHAVIRGSAINNDGSTKVSYTAPSVDGQAEVVVQALANASVAPDAISYIETHGTGTALGDPIEIRALCKAFASDVRRGQCAIGSVKANIGHLDAAAGIVGVIKTVLALGNEQIPPSINCPEPNPAIAFPNTPFFVNRSLRPWPRGESPRLAGVSAFGVGGTNAHVILQEAPVRAASPAPRKHHLLALSARTEAALRRAAGNLADHLLVRTGIDLADAAWTLQVGRSAFTVRWAGVVASRAAAVGALQRVAENAEPIRTASGTEPVIFSFPEMECDAPSLTQLQKAVPALRLPQTLLESMNARAHGVGLQIAIARLLLSCGVRPAGVIGAGAGEFAAAAIAGVMPARDAIAAAETCKDRRVLADRIYRMKLSPAAIPVLDCRGQELTPVPNIASASRWLDPARFDQGSTLPANGALAGAIEIGSRVRTCSGLLSRLAELWLCGQQLVWSALYEGEERFRVPLPGYAFERRRYWIEPDARHAAVHESEAAETRPRHPRPALRIPYARPRTDLEQKLAALWAGMLGLDRVGAEDNFFELGGDSLLALQVVERIRRDLHFEITAASLYESLTVRSLAATLEESRTAPVADAVEIAARRTRLFKERRERRHAIDFDN